MRVRRQRRQQRQHNADAALLYCEAADGLDPNFEGVSLMACHIRQLCYKPSSATSHSWSDSAPNNPSQQHAEQPPVLGRSSDPALMMSDTTTNYSPSHKESPPHQFE
ncbi:hypothetical protein HPB50_013661 [Hyalomma asiaticum]|uniref:Uncharacterized protein n=1 Tax=Hyalomma asiaticum TaxID=266040 RepID=A0ACB7SCH5_HYAAI|nr:hypothetical protein HPB50_013661 [Hyalomma asiaticum]